jgi:hypothetical protein
VPFLTINSVPVLVSVDSASLEYARVGGEQERGPSGDLVGGETVRKREWRMTTTPVPGSEVDAWTNLIEGSGHCWPFDVDLYSTRGRGPSSGTAALVATGKYGGSSLEVLNTDVMSWPLGLGSAWTVLAWINNQSGSGWKHRIFRSGGAEWVNGALLPLNEGEVAVSSGALGLIGAHGSDWLFDDVVAYPFAVPDAWVPALYAQHSASAWSALPRVLAGGTFSPAAVTVRGKVTDTRLLRYTHAGALTTGHTLEFTLREV